MSVYDKVAHGVARQSLGTLLSITCLASVVAQASEEDVARLHRNPSTIGIATGHSVPVHLAPAVATVITADELDAIGVTTLSEALTLVPGLNVLYRPQLQGSIFIFRGVRSNSSFNPDWLLLLDGIPQNDVLLGNQRTSIGEVPIQNIERIEVIRGPGSALYGTDAFAGVVNIVTRRPGNVLSTQARVRVGSFDTSEVRLLQPGEAFGVKSLLSFQYKKTEGYEPFFEEDAQTALDRLYGTNASQAPGHSKSWFEGYQFSLEFEQGPWRTRVRRRAQELAAPDMAAALDDKGFQNWDMNSVDLMYNQRGFARDWDLRGSLSWFRFNYDTHESRFYPAGSFGGTFPDGVQDEIGYTEDRFHSELAAVYKGLRLHSVLFGAGSELHRVTDARETRNYSLNSSGVPVPLGGMVELSESEAFVPPRDRHIYFVYAQDEWNFAPDWTLTSGLRYDRYSDFGSTTNPRLALVWATTSDLTTKLLAGRAFRAPTFLDLYTQNNIAVRGNPNLKPEVITTYEVAFDYRPAPTFRTGVNLFYHEIENKIKANKSVTPTTNDNIGQQTGRGGEWEFRWDVTSDVTLNGWYAYQRNRVKADDSDPGFAPHHSANLRVDWNFLPDWSFGPSAHWVADRYREAKDKRPPVKDYVLFNTTLRYQPKKSPWSTSLSMFNILDEEARDPSGTGGFTKDYILAPRSIYFEIRFEPRR